MERLSLLAWEIIFEGSIGNKRKVKVGLLKTFQKVGLVAGNEK